MEIFVKKARKKVYKPLGLHIVRHLEKLQRRLRNFAPADDDDIWVRSDDIYGWLRGDLFGRFFSYPGHVRGGNWDLSTVLKGEHIKKSHKFSAINERYSHGKPWRETSIRKHFERILNRHGSVDGYTEFEEWVEADQVRRDRLWQEVKKGLRHSGPEEPFIEPIYVHFDRFGRCLYTSNGNHRLFMAMVLGYEKIPVRVWLRHKLWQDEREKFWRENKNGLSSAARIEDLHPDLRVLVGHHGER